MAITRCILHGCGWRRLAMLVLLLAGLWSPLTSNASFPVVVVLYPETKPPYQQIFADVLSGIEQGVAGATVSAYALAPSSDISALRRWLAQQSPTVIITLGRVPTETYEALGLKIPYVVGTLDASPQTRPHVAGVGLAVDPALLFATLKSLIPTTQRIWVVFNPDHDRWLMDVAKSAAAALDLTIQPLAATDLREAAQHFLRILQIANPATDALWLVTDTAVVDLGTILPLVVEQSWKRRLAVFSNSLQYAQYGTLFALYPDNLRLGRRLAELALQRRHDTNAIPTIEPLRAVKRVLNLKIAARLEVDINQDLERRFDVVLPPW